MIAVSLAPEYVVQVAGITLTNTFLTSLITSFILIIFSALSFAGVGSNSFIVEGVQATLVGLFHLVDSVTEDRVLTKKTFALAATFLLFIGFSNMLALVPGFLGSLFISVHGKSIPLLRSPNSDLTTTVALALVSVFVAQLFSLKALGLGRYIGRFINLRSPLAFIMGFFEFLSETVKILSFSFRLFGNVFAGEVLLLVAAFLLPFVIPIPFMILELFVGLIQALIFAVLTAAFIKNGTIRKT